MAPNVVSDLVILATLRPTPFIGSYKERYPLIRQSMNLLAIKDRSGTVPDVIGHWLVNILHLSSPSMVPPGFRFEFDDRYLNQIELLQHKQVASRVIRVACFVAVLRDSDLEFEVKGRRADHHSCPSSIEKFVQKMAGDGASDEVKEGPMRFFAKAECEQIKGGL